MLAADQDVMVTYENNALPVLDRVGNGQLVTVEGGSHAGFSGSAGILRWLDNPDSLACYVIEDDVNKLLLSPQWELFGSREQGINHDANYDFCQVDPLPESINPLHQQMITAAVVRSFFESQFGADEPARIAAHTYLSQALASEVAGVSWQSATP
jgi:hypothetical protein